MYITQHQFLAFIFSALIVISFQNDISLHYPPNRRSCRDSGSDGKIGAIAQLISLLLFVFYILIILGLIKACLGFCCSESIGLAGLYILMKDPIPNFEYNRNTVFCLNVVYFLVLPIALIQKIRSPFASYEKQKRSEDRMQGGGENDGSSSKINDLIVAPPTSKKKKGHMDIYRDDNDSETQDTKYVLEQLHQSEQSLRSGIYAASTEE